jgi:PHP family Zn ribbon phosphoesterase
VEAVFYDFHLHTALSACGDRDMSPANIVNMAALTGLDMIAITDHNHVGNCAAAIDFAKAAGLPLTVLPGMELETAEEAHFVCLFRDLDMAGEAMEFLAPYRPKLKNREDIFGEQLYFNAADEVVGKEENLLSAALSLSVYDALPFFQKRGADFFPAHIDKPAYSLLSSFGFLPPDLPFRALELSRNADVETLKAQIPLEKYQILRNSDAHYLRDVNERERVLHLPEKSADALFKALLAESG